MKKFILLVIAPVIISACASSGSTSDHIQKPISPCKDSLYLVLSQLPLNSLSTNEYDYFMDYRHACEREQEALYNQSVLEEQERTALIFDGISVVLNAILTTASHPHE